MFVFDPVSRNRHGFGCWVGLIMFWACMLSTPWANYGFGLHGCWIGSIPGITCLSNLTLFFFFFFWLCFMGLLDDSRLHGERSSMNRKLRWEQLGW